MFVINQYFAFAVIHRSMCCFGTALFLLGNPKTYKMNQYNIV